VIRFIHKKIKVDRSITHITMQASLQFSSYNRMSHSHLDDVGLPEKIVHNFNFFKYSNDYSAESKSVIESKFPRKFSTCSSSLCLSPHDIMLESSILIVNSKNIGTKDVLCGRDKLSFGHCGNKRFRVVIDMYRERYQNATLKEDKTKIIMEIVSLISQSGGRFLKRIEDESDSWCLANHQVTREKVSHALRSNKHRRRKTASKGEATLGGCRSMTSEQSLRFNNVLTYQQKLIGRLIE